VNDQSTKKVKCDFTFFFIFNGLTAIEYGSTALCCGNAELIRVSQVINPLPSYYSSILMLYIAANKHMIAPFAITSRLPQSRIRKTTQQQRTLALLRTEGHHKPMKTSLI